MGCSENTHNIRSILVNLHTCPREATDWSPGRLLFLLFYFQTTSCRPIFFSNCIFWQLRSHWCEWTLQHCFHKFFHIFIEYNLMPTALHHYVLAVAVKPGFDGSAIIWHKIWKWPTWCIKHTNETTNLQTNKRFIDASTYCNTLTANFQSTVYVRIFRIQIVKDCENGACSYSFPPSHGI